MTFSHESNTTFKANKSLLVPDHPDSTAHHSKKPELKAKQPLPNPLSTKPFPPNETPPYFCPRCKQHVYAEFRTSGQLSIGQRLELSCQCGSKMLYKSRTDRRMVYDAY